MAEESTYPVATSLLSAYRIRMILNALGGPTGTGSIGIDDFFADQLFQDAVNTWMQNHVFPGTGISLDTVTDPDSMTIINTGGGGGGGGYTDAQAIAAVAAAITPEANMLDKNIVGSVINLGIATALETRLSNLEASSLIQIKDSLGTAGDTSQNYMSFPGTTGNYIDTPSNAAFNVTGNVGWAVRVKMPSSAPASAPVIFSRRGATPATSQFSFSIDVDGQMHTSMYFDGTSGASLAQTSAATPLAFNGNWIWIKIYRTVADGQVSFFTAPDTGSNNIIPSTWTTFQLNRGSQFANTGLWASSGAPFEISGFNAGASSMSSFPVGRVLMYANTTLTGTPVLDANASDYSSGSTWTGPSGNVYTLRGTASIVTTGGGTTAISNTTAEFSLGETDAFSTIAVANHNSLLWSTEATLVNTSGAAVNFTPKLKMAGVDLHTWPAPISIPSTAAGQVYNLGCAVKVSVNAVDGSTQISRAQLIVNNAVTGTDLGSISMASNLANMSGNRTGAIATITSVPQMQLRMTMGTAAATISSRPLRTQLFLAA